MPEGRQVLFVQGGGENTHDEWDAALVDSLRHELGAGWEVRYPRMPNEGDPSDAAWSPVIRRELGLLRMGAAVVGHSVGGTILIRSLAGEPPPVKLGAIVLAAAPFVGAGGWPGDELPRDLGPGFRRTLRSTCSTGSRTRRCRLHMPSCMPASSPRRSSTDCPAATTSWAAT